MLPCRADFVELNDMKILMPKEMKIRLVSNVLGIVFAILNGMFTATVVVQFYDSMLEPEMAMLIIILIASIAATGLSFFMAKIAWALQKKLKIVGIVILVIFAILGIGGNLIIIIPAIINGPIDTTNVAGYIAGITLLGIGGALCLIIARLVGEMIEKLKFAWILGVVCFCIAGIMIAFIPVGEGGRFSGFLGLFISFIGSFVVTITGLQAEAVLIKKKFLVYN